MSIVTPCDAIGFSHCWQLVAKEKNVESANRPSSSLLRLVPSSVCLQEGRTVISFTWFLQDFRTNSVKTKYQVLNLSNSVIFNVPWNLVNPRQCLVQHVNCQKLATCIPPLIMPQNCFIRYRDFFGSWKLHIPLLFSNMSVLLACFASGSCWSSSTVCLRGCLPQPAWHSTCPFRLSSRSHVQSKHESGITERG